MANRFLSNISINDAYTFPASDGSFGQAIVTDGAGNLSFGDVASGGSSAASVIFKDNFTGDGVETEFSMARGVTNEDQTQIYIDGAYQEKGTYTVAGNLITFSTAPASGHSIEVMTISGINTGPTTLYQDNFTGNGATTDFTLANSVDNEIKTMVFLNGVYQFKGTYSTSGTTLSFDTAPGNGTLIEVITIASAASPSEAQRVLFYGKASGAISKGDAVMFAGAEGDHFLFAKATQAAIAANHEYFIGLADQDFSNNEFGYVVEFGNITNIDTTVYTSTAGTTLWFDSEGSTAGAITETEPTPPNAKIQVAAVIRLHASVGSLFVRPTWYHELGELHDVSITSAADKDLLVWDAANGYWENSKTVDTLTATTLSATTLTGTLSTAAQSNVTSVGTLSSLAVSGNLTVDTNTLYVDAANNSVGFGTTSPSANAKIHILESGTPFASAAGTVAVFQRSGASFNGSVVSIIGGNGGSSTLNFGDTDDENVGFINYIHSDNYLALGTNASERLRIDSAGNLGISTTSPAYKLDVAGGSGFRDTLRILSGSTETVQLSWTGTNNGVINVLNGGTIGVQILGSGNTYFNGGNVGIGTSSPLSTIHSSAPYPTYTDNGIVFRGGTTNNNSHSGISLISAGDALGGQIGSNYLVNGTTVSQTNSNRSSAFIQFSNTTGAGQTSAISFGGLVKGTTTKVERMRIDNNGYVGIGESVPLVPLHISRDSASGENIALILDNNNNTANNEVALLFRSYVGATNTDFQIATINKSANAADLVFRSDGAVERMRIDNNGNVGIGQTVPASLFHLKSDAPVLTSEATNGVSGFRINILGGGSQLFRLQNAGTTKLQVDPNGAIYLGGSTAAANALDDYEEGTWAPTLTDGTNTATPGIYNVGRYVKIGKVVYITFVIHTSSLGSVTGNIQVSGLPFTANSDLPYGVCVGNSQLLNITAGYSLGARVTNNQAYVELWIGNSTAGMTRLQASQWSNDGYANISGHYHA